MPFASRPPFAPHANNTKPHADMRPTDNGRSQERENQLFEYLLFHLGAYELEAKIQKLESTRKYYRRYPYDNNQKRAGLDAIDLPSNSNPLAELIADESRAELLGGLTEREQWVANRAEEGYKPRDMAELRGVATSNADRWIKHNVKQKLISKLEQTR